MFRRSATAAACLASLAFVLAPGPASPQFNGGEIQVNASTVNSQLTATRRAVAVEDNGDFVVVWTSVGQDGSGEGVFGQRFASSGARLGSEFRANSYTPGDQGSAAVASDADGDFVVVWNSNHQDGDELGVFARRFSSTGIALATEFQVNLATLYYQHSPAVASDAAGGFVVAWSGYYSVAFRRYDSAGSALGGEGNVAFSPDDLPTRPAIAMDGGGGFVIVWEAGAFVDVYGQVYDSSGAPVGSRFQVNGLATGAQLRPEVARAGNGDFVVAWQSSVGDGSQYGVFARSFDAIGTPKTSDFQVNTYAYGGQYQPSVAVDSKGDFVIAWESNSQEPGNGSGIFLRGFDDTGLPTSGEFHVNTTLANHQVLAAVGAGADGNLVVAWSSNGQDGSGYGVVARRLHAPSVLDVDGNGQLSALTDGLLLLRFFFGFTGSSLTTGVVGPNCSRCDSATILAYLQSLA